MTSGGFKEESEIAITRFKATVTLKRAQSMQKIQENRKEFEKTKQ